MIRKIKTLIAILTLLITILPTIIEAIETFKKLTPTPDVVPPSKSVK